MLKHDVVDPGDVGMAADRIELARRMVHEHVASGGTPAATALVLRHGQTVLAEAYGVQGPGGAPLEMDAVWPLASMTKPLTAAVVLSLAEDGLLGVMDPVVDHLPELEGTGSDDVLVHHLLTHTAGWEAPMFNGRLLEALTSGEVPDAPAGWTELDHALWWVAIHPQRRWDVGEMMCYATVNYSLLSEIVRRVTAQSLDAVMRERLFVPLRMDGSSMVVGDELRPRLVRRDETLPFGGPFGVALQGPEIEASDDGGIGAHGTAGDFATFCQMILDGGAHEAGRVLAASSIQAMGTDQVPGVAAHLGTDRTIPTASWSYGFGIRCEQQWPFFGGGLVPFGSLTHPGAGGVSFWIDRQHDLVGVFFEVIMRVSPDLEPVSGIGHRFQDVITGAIR